ncbi:MAG: hypothetical protein JW720_07180 [Sedimentisphaerales bacterium]|nr:hypothetical protein [Sedimentisphaerales bacterium]
MAQRSHWVNCFGPIDESLITDSEVFQIDAMSRDLAPLDKNTSLIRQLITGFEACYHQADKEAERIIKAVAAGKPPRKSTARPAKRKRELVNAHRLLSDWRKDHNARPAGVRLGRIRAAELLAPLASPTALMKWQVDRVIDRIGFALDPSTTTLQKLK